MTNFMLVTAVASEQQRDISILARNTPIRFKELEDTLMPPEPADIRKNAASYA